MPVLPLLAGLLLATLQGATPAPTLSPSPPRLLIEAPPALEPIAQRLRALGPGGLLAALRLTGLADPGPPIRVLLAREGSDLARNVPPWVSGYALGEMGLVVLLPGREPTYPDASLAELLDHEVAHVLIARAAGGRALPRFWNEGLAMAAAGSWGLEDRSRVALASLRGRDLSVAELDRLFAGGPGEVASAYALSFAFIQDVLDRWGPGAPAAILSGVAHGRSFEDAFQQATGTALATAAADFARRETFWYRWLPLLTSSVTLWIGITGLALWAGGRRRARTAAIHRRWEEEEEARRQAAALGEGEDGPVN
jgi:peptidase MA superfamily protein